MNNAWNKFKANRDRGSKTKNLVISIVILIEVIAVMVVGSFAWVETISSIKIKNFDEGTVNSYLYNIAQIGDSATEIDLADYFRQGGDMHLAPASSADGVDIFFPKTAGVTGKYRKADTNDKNVSYLSVSFKITVAEDSDFFFSNGNPTFGSFNDDIRVSVLARDEDKATLDDHYVFARTAQSGASVVNTVNGDSTTINVRAFSNYTKNRTKLFKVEAGTDKIVTVNLWLQKQSGDNATDLTSATNMSTLFNITNLGIISDKSPRRVTLIPTPAWDTGEANQTFYAWCWKTGSSELYKLNYDAETEHYSFEYNGTYDHTLFFRINNANVTKDNISSYWSSGKQTEDTAIPAASECENPTYVITSFSGGSSSKSTGEWIKNSSNKADNPSSVTIKYVNGQDSSWGTISATSYTSSTETTSTYAMELTNRSNPTAVHYDTIHAMPGKKLKLTATAASTDYAFVGWFTNPAGTVAASGSSTSTSYSPSAPAADTGVTYYAKFKERRTLKIYKYLDGAETNATTASGVGTITIGTSTSGANVTSYSQTFDKDQSVAFSAAASAGYTLEGIYTQPSGINAAVSPVTLSANTEYYARFTTNEYNVTASAYYSNNGGSSYSSGSTGGTVKAGSSAAGATSTASVKYKNSVNLVATPASGYQFVGWYSAATGGTHLSTNTTYSYTMNSTSAQNVYARFMKLSTVTIYIAPRENWDEPDLHIWDSNGVIEDHLTASYDGTTGYFVATVQTRGTWLKAILSKDSNYTSQTSDITVVSSVSAGTDYSKFINTSNTVSNWSSNKRCIWFIISEDWLKNYITNNHDWMRIWSSNNSAAYSMRRINDYAYVYEFNPAPSGTIYFQDCYQNSTNYRDNNQWTTTIPSGKSQYKETSYNGGSWQ